MVSSTLLTSIRIRFNMLYNNLLNLLQGLERMIPCSTPTHFSSISEVITPPNVQVYGLDTFTHKLNLPTIVIAIGSNYTQGSTSFPRKTAPSLYPVEDDLNKCRTNFLNGYNAYKNALKLWVDNCAASSAGITMKDTFHFVMTNFCLWITKKSWQNIPENKRTDLLRNNPPSTQTKSGSPPPGDWQHLLDLANALKEENVIWVGHGIHCEVFALFRQFMGQQKKQQWLLMPNLAFHYKYGSSSFPQ